MKHLYTLKIKINTFFAQNYCFNKRLSQNIKKKFFFSYSCCTYPFDINFLLKLYQVNFRSFKVSHITVFDYLLQLK